MNLYAALLQAAEAGSEPAAILLWAILGDKAAEELIIQTCLETMGTPPSQSLTATDTERGR